MFSNKTIQQAHFFSKSIMFSSSSKERKHIIKYWRNNFGSNVNKNMILTIVRKSLKTQKNAQPYSSNTERRRRNEEKYIRFIKPLLPQIKKVLQTHFMGRPIKNNMVRSFE